MPTARELLEQADALMRRNRMGTGGDAAGRPPPPGSHPPSPSPAPGLPASPRTIQREPIAPSVAHTPLPVDPTESPAFTVRALSDEPSAPPPLAAPPPLVAPLTEPRGEAEAEFPLLTDAVDEAKEAAGAPLDDLVDDVPLLIDAVEEIDVGIVDEAARGEPSFWELTARGETSVLGPAPDSIVVVPLPEAMPPAVPQSPPEGRDPLGLDQPPAAPSDSPSVDGSESADRGGAMPQSDDAWTVNAEAADLAQPETPETPETPGIEPSEAFAEPSTVDSWSGARPVPADEPEAVFLVPPPEGMAPTAEEAAVAASETTAGSFVEPPVPPVSEFDQQRIREIAEEIGMQVLQRIDIFTDTTLRAQLAQRLRPVVDRAAADLVAAINEHVGELLRAYVSEAIEREIESWRRK